MSSPTSTPEETLQTEFEGALNALLSSPTTTHITPSSTPVHERKSDSYKTSATYDFPDGGRFRISLAGPPFTPFVDGQQGLPDGFLMEINNHIFSQLCLTTTPTPEEAVSSILGHASSLYARFMEEQRRKRDDPASDDDLPVLKMDNSRAATASLMKQLSMLEKQDTRRDGFIAKPKDDNLYIWTLQLFFDPGLQSKLSELGYEALELELRFPGDFPYSPPFVRVVAPYIKCKYVLPSGGICMQLFSTSGWTPVNSIDAVCVQVRAMLLAGDLEFVKDHNWKYSYDGAKRDLQMAVRRHRWDKVGSEKGPRRTKKMKS